MVVSGGPKKAPLTSLAKTVKFGTMLRATFLNISSENYTNTWFKSNAIGILFVHTDVTRWEANSCSDGSLTAPSMNDIAGWSASSSNRKDRIYIYIRRKWHNKDCCAMRHNFVCLKLSNIIILNVNTRALNSSLHYVSMHEQNTSSVWPGQHICVFSGEILKNVATNVVRNFSVFGQRFTDISQMRLMVRFLVHSYRPTLKQSSASRSH